jgi:hypothetical protein
MPKWPMTDTLVFRRRLRDKDVLDSLLVLEHGHDEARQGAWLNDEFFSLIYYKSKVGRSTRG